MTEEQVREPPMPQMQCPTCPYMMVHSSSFRRMGLETTYDGFLCTKCGTSVSRVGDQYCNLPQLHALALVGLRSIEWRDGRIDDRYHNEEAWRQAVDDYKRVDK